jgi:hypothetical protein
MWTEQGNKLEDDAGVGAAWVFTRSNGVWSQQSSKLVGSGAVGKSELGSSVTLSADGNTAIVGGWGDNAGVGASWVFTRSNGVWSQQSSKLVGGGAVGPAHQGGFVALSSDGNTAILGWPEDDAGVGAAWVVERSVRISRSTLSCLLRPKAYGTSLANKPACVRADVAERMLVMLRAQFAEMTAQRDRWKPRFDQLKLPPANTSERRPWWRRLGVVGSRLRSMRGWARRSVTTTAW